MSSKQSSTAQSQQNSRQVTPLIKDERPKRLLIKISKTKLFKNMDNFLDFLMRFKTKRFLKTCAIILLLVTIYIIGSLDRYCDKNWTTDCKPCPKNAVCFRYTFKCVNGTYKGYDHCFDTIEEKMNEKPNQFLLMICVSVFSLWIILILFARSL